MADSDISDYTYERTLLMEQRNEMLKEMKVSDKRKGKMVSLPFFLLMKAMKERPGRRNHKAPTSLIKPLLAGRSLTLNCLLYVHSRSIN